jgi:hypothetical protein
VILVVENNSQNISNNKTILDWQKKQLSETKLSVIACSVILLSILFVALNVQSAKSGSTATIGTTIFTDSFFVESMHFKAPNVPLYGGTIVRIVFNASKPIDFYCQNSWDYDTSSSNNWTAVQSQWSNKTSFLDRTFTIPTTGRFYFTFVNYEHDVSLPPIDIFYVTLYRIDTYEIRVGSDKQSYSMGEQALLTANAKNDSNPLPGLSVSLQVFSPDGDIIDSQNNLTDSYGQVTISLILPFEEGLYHCVAKTSVAGNFIEDSAIFVAVKNSTLPSTFDNYDGLWHTRDFTITLMAFDGEIGVAETYYRINNGPTQNLGINGQPIITMESGNNTLEYWSEDNAGHEEFPHRMLTGIKLDKTPPSGSILIDGNQTCVNSTFVTLTLSASDSASGVAQMRFSNENMTWSYWETFSSSSNWTLASGDGTKTIYAQFRDDAGLVSSTSSDTLILDTTVPMIENVLRIPENEVQPAQGAKISVNVTDLESGVKSVILSYTAGNTTTWFDSQMVLNAATGLYECTVPGQQANARVEYRILAYDNAGNEEIGDDQGQYYVYTVVPEYLPLQAAFLFVTVTSLMVAYRRKDRATEENSAI